MSNASFVKFRLILAKKLQNKGLPNVLEKYEKEVSTEWLKEKNENGYNIYFTPNTTDKDNIKHLNGTHIVNFDWLFVDMDLKDGIYKSFKDFMNTISKFPLKPTSTTYTGNGMHVYWKVSGMESQDYSILQRKLISHFKTDPSVCTLYQLMRLPGYYNTKTWVLKEEAARELIKNKILFNTKKFGEVYIDNKKCEVLDKEDFRDPSRIYTVDSFYKALPKELEGSLLISLNKERNTIFGTDIDEYQTDVTELPEKFEKLMKAFNRVKLWFYEPDDRSKCDMKIANVLFRQSFSKEEAYAVLINGKKAKEKKQHGPNYVRTLIEKVWKSPYNMMDQEFQDIAKECSKITFINNMKADIDEYTTTQKYNQVQQWKALEAKQGTFSYKNSEQVRADYYLNQKALQDKSVDESLPCITSRLSKVVPIYGNSLIFIGAMSGRGKSTTSGNMVVPMLKAGKRILYVSSEEKAEDIYTRVASIQNGWVYANERNWSVELRQRRDEAIKKLVMDNKLVVVDSYSPALDKKSKKTIEPPDITTVEGFQTAITNIIEEDSDFDVLIIDYITKINKFAKQFKSEEWRAINEAGKIIEEWSKKYTIPTIVFAQLHANNEKDSLGIQARMQGCKRIYNYASCVIELVTNYDDKTTKWICHKMRKGINFIKTLKLEKGKYIDFKQDGDTEENEEY